MLVGGFWRGGKGVCEGGRGINSCCPKQRRHRSCTYTCVLTVGSAVKQCRLSGTQRDQMRGQAGQYLLLHAFFFFNKVYVDSIKKHNQPADHLHSLKQVDCLIFNICKVAGGLTEVSECPWGVSSRPKVLGGD